ncbi:hypothetical protein LCGC14_1077810, partial [marine sediment metagenome]
ILKGGDSNVNRKANQKPFIMTDEVYGIVICSIWVVLRLNTRFYIL